MSQIKWTPTQKIGVRYYTQKNKPRLPGNRIDRCYGIRYAIKGKRFETVLGWQSEGWTEERAFMERSRIIQSAKIGGPASLKEEQNLAEHRKIAKEKADRAENFKNMSFREFTENEFFPISLSSIKPKTAKDYRDHCAIWIYPVVGDLPFRDISLHDAQKIKSNMLKAGRASRTIQSIFRTFTSIWYGAMDAGLTHERPPTKQKAFKLPKIDNKRERFLTFEEADKLLDAVRKRSKQAYQLALLSLHTGMRWGEVRDLKWQAVNLDLGLIHVLGAKGDKSRTLIMGRVVRDLFETMPPGKPGDYVFPGRSAGGPLFTVPGSFKRSIHDTKLNEGITDKKLWISFHSLRHTHASWLRKSGAGLATIQEILGHSSVLVTQRYAHVEHREIKNAMGSFDAMLEAAKNDNNKVIPLKGISNV